MLDHAYHTLPVQQANSYLGFTGLGYTKSYPTEGIYIDTVPVQQPSYSGSLHVQV